MFSETILIEHGQIQYSSSHQSDNQVDKKRLNHDCNGSDSIGTYYKTHMVEKQYSLEQLDNNEHLDDNDEVRCFVRSEIKWVFLKNIKVVICVFSKHSLQQYFV